MIPGRPIASLPGISKTCSSKENRVGQSDEETKKKQDQGII
jgi:hypothetical protein